MAKACPEGYHSATPSITFKDTRKAISFYQKAFGAKERMVLPGPGGKGVMHAEFQIGNSILMAADEMPGFGCLSAETMKGAPVSFYLYVEDADSVFKQAVAAGAQVVMPMNDAFWGDRMGVVKDSFGLSWNIATHVKDPSPQEIKEGADAFMAGFNKK